MTLRMSPENRYCPSGVNARQEMSTVWDWLLNKRSPVATSHIIRRRLV